MKTFKTALYDAGGTAIGFVTVISVGFSLVAENINVDPATVMGGGGLTMGGFLLHAIWKYLHRYEKLQDLHEKVATAQLTAIMEETAHRTAERSHWNMVEQRLEWQGKVLERIDTGRFTPVEGIPLEPGTPRR